MKQKIEFTDNVSETLLIPLWMRAINPKLDDEHSRAIVEQIDYDFEKFSVDKGSLQGVGIRTLYLQKVIQEFIDNHDRAVIVMLGCGLDPQSRRIERRRDAMFYALDLPDVIALRCRFLPATDYEQCIADSVFSTTWMDALKAKHPDQPFLFIAEGLMMYFTEAENRKLLGNLSERFHGAELYLERMSRLAVNKQKHHKSISQTSATVKWGADSPREVCAWRDGITAIADYKYLPHADGIFGLLGRLVPPLANSCGIWGFRL